MDERRKTKKTKKINQTNLKEVNQQQNKPVTTECAITGRVQVPIFRPVFDQKHQIAHSGVNGSVGTEQLCVRHSQLVLQ